MEVVDVIYEDPEGRIYFDIELGFLPRKLKEPFRKPVYPETKV
jgi:hypothetical protein